MRVVIDTNVFISAALKQTSVPALAIRVVEQQKSLLKSLATERQLFEVLARPYLAPLISPNSAAWLNNLMALAEMVAIFL